MLKPPPPVLVAPLFAPLHAELLSLLRGLAPADWERGTSATGWHVRDVVAHLLDGDLRALSYRRDGASAPPLHPDESLQAFLDRLNSEWVTVARRFSPRALVEAIESTGPRIAAFMESLDPLAPAHFAVSWAGQDASPMWLDIGRELTERWHHQQQVRDAVGAEPLTGPAWLRPVLAVSVHALPAAYARVGAPSGTAVVLQVTGEAGGDWTVRRREGEGWELLAGRPKHAAATVVLDAETACRGMLKLIDPTEARRRAVVSGDESLAAAALQALAVVARPH